MAKFFEALFSGTTTLDAYVPDTGALPASTEIDLYNTSSYYYNYGAVPALSSVDVVGGFAKARYPDLGGTSLALKLPTPPSANYYVELEFDIDPTLSTFNALLMMRATSMTVGAWDSGAFNYVGPDIEFAGGSGALTQYIDYPSDGSTGYDTVGSSTLSAGVQTFTLRAEVSGNTLTSSLNGTVFDTRTLTDPNYVAAGSAIVVLDFASGYNDGTHILVPIRRITAETIGPAPVFVLDELVKSTTPAIPGSPGTPPIPAHFENRLVGVWVPQTIVAHFPPAGGPGQPGAHVISTTSFLVDGVGVVQVSYSDGSYDLIYTTGHEETQIQQVFVPADPGTPPSGGMPTQYHQGWTGSARSIDAILGDGMYQFSVPGNVIGVVTGFGEVNTGPSYADILYGLYFTGGTVRVAEAGVPLSAITPYTSGDVFTIARLGGQVRYFQNSTLLYTSTARSSGSVFVDASLFFGGDGIVNGSVVSGVTPEFAFVGDGNGSLVLEPLIASGATAGESGWAALALNRLVVSGATYNETDGALALSSLSVSGYGSPGNGLGYAIGSLSLNGIVASGESGLFAPDWAVGDLIISPLLTYGLAYNGGAGDGNIVLGGLHVFGAQGAGGYAELVLPGLGITGYDATAISTNVMIGSFGYYSMFALANPGVATGFVGAYGAYQLTAHTSSKAIGDLPGATFAGTAVGTGLAVGVGALPSCAFSATAIGAGVATMAVAPVGMTAFYAQTAGRASGVLPAIANFVGIALAGGVGTLAVHTYLGQLGAIGVALNFVRGVGNLPGYRMMNGAQFAGSSRLGILRALAEAIADIIYEGYSVTLIAGPDGMETRTTHLTQAPFEHIVRFGTRYFGVATDGLYELVGDLYGDQPIVSVIETMPAGMDTPNLKRPRSLIVGGRLGGDMICAFTAGEAQEAAYLYQPADSVGLGRFRVKFARGYRSQYLGYSFINASGRDFQIDNILPEYDELRRLLGAMPAQGTIAASGEAELAGIAVSGGS